MTNLPHWPDKTIAVLSTVGASPHAIPVTAPIRVDDSTIMFALHESRDSLARLRLHGGIALTLLAGNDTAFTFRGRAQAGPNLVADPRYVAVRLDVSDVDDHRSPAFAVTAGVDRDWTDLEERALAGARAGELPSLLDRWAARPGAAAHAMGVSVVSVPVSDPGVSRDFYTQMLGFEIAREDATHPGMHWVQLSAAGCATDLVMASWFETMAPGSLRGLVVTMADLPGSCERLGSSGVAFQKPMTQEDWGPEAVVEDPDGNQIVLHQAS